MSAAHRRPEQQLLGRRLRPGRRRRVYDFDEHARFSINVRNLTEPRYIEQPFNQWNNTPGAPLSILATITARM